MSTRFITALALVLLISPAVAATRVIDGDTLDIDGVRIRIVNVDTPETSRSRCAHELALGIKAKARLQVLLDGGGKVTFTPTGTDRYGRTLAHVFVDGADAGERLIAEGHAVRWKPGVQAKAQRLALWCGT